MLYGTRVYVSEHVPDKTERKQVRFPKSRKRRIRRKWAKNPRNWREKQVPLSWRTIGGDVICNQAFMAELRAFCAPSRVLFPEDIP